MEESPLSKVLRLTTSRSVRSYFRRLPNGETVRIEGYRAPTRGSKGLTEGEATKKLSVKEMLKKYKGAKVTLKTKSGKLVRGVIMYSNDTAVTLRSQLAGATPSNVKVRLADIRELIPGS